MASTYDYISETNNQYFGTDLPAHALNRAYVVQRTVNIATALAAVTTSGTSNFTDGDALKLIDVPAYTWVIATFLRVTTAGTASVTLDVGDADADEFSDNLALDAVGIKASFLSRDAAVANGGGKFYITADTIDVAMVDANASTGIFTLTVVMVDVS